MRSQAAMVNSSFEAATCIAMESDSTTNSLLATAARAFSYIGQFDLPAVGLVVPQEGPPPDARTGDGGEA